MWVMYWHDVVEIQIHIAVLGCLLLGFAAE
jgi:hypothetical protein